MHNRRPRLPSRSDQPVILVVDDEPAILIVAKATLEREGYFVLTAADGEEALLQARAYPGTIHLVLTDIVMPRLDGLALRQRIMEERPATRVLLMSAHAKMAPLETQLLRKPFDIALLLDWVRRALCGPVTIHP